VFSSLNLMKKLAPHVSSEIRFTLGKKQTCKSVNYKKIFCILLIIPPANIVCLSVRLSVYPDPNMKMCTLVVYPGPSSIPRIMSLKVMFQICFGSIKMMGTLGY
jgi:hypothetical protein